MYLQEAYDYLDIVLKRWHHGASIQSMVVKKLKCNLIVKTVNAYAQKLPQLFIGIGTSDPYIFIYEVKALSLLFRME